MFHTLRSQFEGYALLCGADLRVCTTPPDPGFHRSILAQKLLLPSVYREYEWIAFLDLDILVANNPKSIFKSIRSDKAFSAVVTPRHSQKFKNLVLNFYKKPEILLENHESYFYERGYAKFPKNTQVIGSINGGALLCNPTGVGDLFRDAYYSNFKEKWVNTDNGNKRNPLTHEEGLMAYLSQSNNLFFPMEAEFNRLFLHEVFSDLDSPIAKFVVSPYYKVLFHMNKNIFIPSFLFPKIYANFIKYQLDKSSLLHFGGGFPFIHFLNQ